jgi:23S rRNA pseudouridine2605 synthase
MHVGRLDVDTTGALLFTTDGVLCHGLLGPGSGHAEKTYLATLRGGPKGLDAEGIARLKRGVRLPGKRQRTVHGRAMNVGTVRHAPRTESVWVGGGQRRVQGGGVRGGESDEDRSRPGGGEQMRQQEFRESAVVELTVAEGANHQVKHMLGLVGRPLWRLHRKVFCGIGVEGLAEGQCRELRQDEVARLYRAAEANSGGGGGGGGAAGRSSDGAAAEAAGAVLIGETKMRKRKRTQDTLKNT